VLTAEYVTGANTTALSPECAIS